MLLAALLALPIGASAQSAVTLPYTCGFEAADDATQWTLVNGSYTNKWVIGSAENNGGTKSLYISNDNGASNAYTISTTSYVYAYFDVEVTEAGQYGIEFDWKAQAESCCDYLVLYVVPSTESVTSGSVPSGWSDYKISTNLNVQSTWQHYTAIVDVLDSMVGSYHVVLYWKNDGSVGTQPPAAIDNVHVQQITCPAVYNLRTESADSNSATIAWTPFGTETSWLVYLNGELNGTATDSTYTITGLDANTAYTVGVRALCGAGDTALTTATIVRTACAEMVPCPMSPALPTTLTPTPMCLSAGTSCARRPTRPQASARFSLWCGAMPALAARATMPSASYTRTPPTPA